MATKDMTTYQFPRRDWANKARFRGFTMTTQENTFSSLTINGAQFVYVGGTLRAVFFLAQQFR